MPGKTMMQTPTVETVYVVRKDGAMVLETYMFSEAQATKRRVKGELVAVKRDVSPS